MKEGKAAVAMLDWVGTQGGTLVSLTGSNVLHPELYLQLLESLDMLQTHRPVNSSCKGSDRVQQPSLMLRVSPLLPYLVQQTLDCCSDALHSGLPAGLRRVESQAGRQVL